MCELMTVPIVSLRLVLLTMTVGVPFFNLRYIPATPPVVAVTTPLFVEMSFATSITVIPGPFVSLRLMALLCFRIRPNMLCGRFTLLMTPVNVTVPPGANLSGPTMTAPLAKRVGVTPWVTRKNGKPYGRTLAAILSVCPNRRTPLFG